MYYLPAWIETCLKATIAMFCFCCSKNPSNIKKIYLIPFLYILEKRISLVTNIRKKYVTGKVNPYFFDVMKHGQIFLSKVCHFQFGHRFLFSTEMSNIRKCEEVCLRKLIKFRL